jgi:hypothetical protein
MNIEMIAFDLSMEESFITQEDHGYDVGTGVKNFTFRDNYICFNFKFIALHVHICFNLGIIILNSPDLSTVWRFTPQCTKIGT